MVRYDKDYWWIACKDRRFYIFKDRKIFNGGDLSDEMWDKESNILQPRFGSEESANKVLEIIEEIGHEKTFELLKELPTWFFDGFLEGR